MILLHWLFMWVSAIILGYMALQGKYIDCLGHFSNLLIKFFQIIFQIPLTELLYHVVTLTFCTYSFGYILKNILQKLFSETSTSMEANTLKQKLSTIFSKSSKIHKTQTAHERFLHFVLFCLFSCPKVWVTELIKFNEPFQIKQLLQNIANSLF